MPQSDPALLQKLTPLRVAGKLLSLDQVRAALKSPTPAPLTLPPPATTVLTPAQIAATARKAMIRIGWLYLCKNCNSWHTNMMGGYALTADGAVATCHHGLDPKDDLMREAYLFAATTAGDVFPVRAILAADPILDATILQLEAAHTTPLPLNDQHAPGDAAYIFSDPEHVGGYFSAGLINRFYWNTPGVTLNPATLAGARYLRLHVSVDWAPGSSGAAVLDDCGNAIAHVARIQSLTAPTAPAPPITASTTRPSTPDPKPAYLTLHEAIPARGVRLLVESMSPPPHPKP